MSDSEDYGDDDFMVEDDDFGFDESESDEDGNSGLENQYYNAKAKKDESIEDALKDFKAIVDSDSEKTEWGFKALKQSTKLHLKSSNHQKTLDVYSVLLSYMTTSTSLTKNYVEKSLNNVLDLAFQVNDLVFLEKFFKLTLDALEIVKNDKLIQKTNLKLGKMWLDRKEYDRLLRITRELHAGCLNDDGSDDQKKGTLLLEIFALEIQMYTETKDNKKLKSLYNQCLSVRSAISHPKIMGVIRECGGKMHMDQHEWVKAQTDFFEAFKNYDEAGSEKRIVCLKYLVLANMLMESNINPFDSQETKPYKNDSEILAMTNLVGAFQRNDIKEFEKIIKNNKRTIMDDPFIRSHIDSVLKNIRTKVLIELIKPYTRLKIPFASKEINATVEEVEELLVGLILDDKISGRIDQVDKILILYGRDDDDVAHYGSVGKWSDGLGSLYKGVVSRLV